jgi:hypothetical protein
MSDKSTNTPPAVQLPAEAHDTDGIEAYPPALRVPEPGTSVALPQVPLVSSTTNAWVCPLESM